ncbi:MAG: outer membrane lipid asymmetry maintenance protein MlaD [Rickettsiales bacterium]|nr:outer membrane lipid asymmetry maintenance protein MlaD [Rickettsiales bacterium]
MNKNNNYFEIIVGTFVLFSAIFFFFNSFKNSKVSATKGYYLIAKFDNTDGLAPGSDIKISGVKIGTVTEQFLDQKTYRATLKLAINDQVKLAADSSAKIASEGLLGSKYLSIEPGAEEEILKEGEEIKFTQSSVNLEDLLGKFIFSSNSDKKNEKK